MGSWLVRTIIQNRLQKIEELHDSNYEYDKKAWLNIGTHDFICEKRDAVKSTGRIYKCSKCRCQVCLELEYVKPVIWKKEVELWVIMDHPDDNIESCDEIIMKRAIG